MMLSDFHYNPSCEGCPLHSTANSVCVPTIRAESEETGPCIVFVGRNPGYEEDQRNEPFVGQSGVLLRGGSCQVSLRNGGTRTFSAPRGDYIDYYRLRDLATIYLTNAVRCYTPSNDKPPLACAKACTPRYLLDDLSTIADHHPDDKKVLVLLGADAITYTYRYIFSYKQAPTLSKALSNQATVERSATGDEWTVFIAYHPAYILRNPNALRASVYTSMRLVRDYLLDLLPTPSTPRIVPTRSPS